jgi:ABC-2 type transport system permease protein
MQQMDLIALRKQRMKRYWLSIAPYLKYVGGSLPGFALIIGFSFYGYSYFVYHQPQGFPLNLVITALLTWAIMSVSVRTYIQEADTVFLLPLADKMAIYLARCLRSAYIRHGLLMSLVWTALWPLFREGTDAAGITYWSILIQLYLLKGVTLFGWWQELNMRFAKVRMRYTMLRGIITLGLVYITVIVSAPTSTLVTGVVLILYVLVLRSPAHYLIHWERLILLEKKRQFSWISILNLFVEVPRLTSVVRRSYGLAKLSQLFKFQQSQAYRYLYILTWIRSDLFGMVTRVTLVGCVLILILGESWIQVGIGLLVIYVTGLQLTELERYHRDLDRSFIYPVKYQQRSSSAMAIVFRIHCVVIVLVSALLLVILDNTWIAVGMACLGVTASYLKFVTFHQSKV